MITCTSEISGKASSGIRRSAQTPASTRRSVPVKTRKVLRAHKSIQRAINLHASFRGHGNLFLGDGLTSLGCQHGDLPGPARLHFSRSLIDAAALFTERDYVTHCGHAHRGHGGHKERYGYLSTRDCRPVGAGELDAESVASLARRRRV